MKDYTLKINGHSYNVQIDKVNADSTQVQVVVNGETYEVEVEGSKTTKTSKPQVAPAPKEANSAQITPVHTPAAPRPVVSAATGCSIKCPLPGTVVAIKVAVGDKVAANQTLLVLEAMKMENNIDATSAGVVKQILVQQGATVMEGDTLIVIE